MRVVLHGLVWLSRGFYWLLKLSGYAGVLLFAASLFVSANWLVAILVLLLGIPLVIYVWEFLLTIFLLPIGALISWFASKPEYEDVAMRYRLGRWRS